jgi:copper chaperone NosL
VKNLFSVIIITGIVFFAGCSNSPKPIVFGEDNCDNCKMTITDSKYGAELITSKGKIYKYDSIECLADVIKKNKFGKEDISSLWVVDFNNPGNFISAENAHYLKNDKFHSPMGLNVLAVESDADVSKIYNLHGGEILKWELVKNYSDMPASKKSSSQNCCPEDEENS